MPSFLNASAARVIPRRAGCICLILAGALVAGQALAAPASDTNSNRATQDTGYALVQLNGEPLATYVRTKPPKGKKIDFASNTARAYRAQLSNRRNDYKAWLRANVPQASVTGEFDISLNAVAVKLGGASLAQVSATSTVKAAQYQGLFYPNQVSVVDPDLALISAEQAWARNGGTAATAGAGVKVAIVDSGVDQSHPCFSDSGYAAANQIGDKRFTNNKVIAARVFNNKLPQNGLTAEAIDSHGTHVAGTVACNFRTPASVSGVSIPYAMSGVAPRALLGNYNVFPGNVGNARSEDILNALEAAYADGMDIANMSLGGGSNGIQDLLTVAVDNLDQANMVVAIASGNEGPGYFTVSSPGMAARGLTAGASSVPHFVGAPVTVAGNTYGAASGDFAVVGASGLTANLEDSQCPNRRGSSRAGGQQRRRGSHCNGQRRERRAAHDPGVHGEYRRRPGVEASERSLRHHRQQPRLCPVRQRQHHGGLQQPGPDRC
jgi:minor extracellular serine protease Vpr